MDALLADANALEADPRSRRTRAVLYESLLGLIKAKGFERVTVAEIASNAAVNRATFYRHYRDKHHMVSMIFQKGVDEALKRIELTTKDGTHAPNQIAQGLESIFEHFAQHDQLFLGLTRRSTDHWFESWLRRFWMGKTDGWLLPLVRTTDSPHLNFHLDVDDASVVVAVNVLCALIAWWLEANRPCSARELAFWYVHFLSGGFPCVRSLSTQTSQRDLSANLSSTR